MMRDELLRLSPVRVVCGRGEIKSFAARNGIEIVSFCRGERKDDRTRQYLRNWTGGEGVLYIGKAWLVASTAMVNQFYFYAVDDDFGPFGGEADLLQIIEVPQPAADIEVVRVVDHRLGAQRAPSLWYCLMITLVQRNLAPTPEPATEGSRE